MITSSQDIEMNFSQIFLTFTRAVKSTGNLARELLLSSLHILSGNTKTRRSPSENAPVSVSASDSDSLNTAPVEENRQATQASGQSGSHRNQ
jgi:hypothetical protein